jgi:hypothetical protein
MTYQMAPDVFACVTGRQCMFLDLRQDRYLSVQRTVMDALAPHIHGWQLPPASPPRSVVLEGEIIQLAADLLAAGILQPYGAQTQRHTTQSLPADRDFTSLRSQENELDINPPRLRVVSALIHADHLLRHVALWRIVRRMSSMASIVRDRPRSKSIVTANALTNSFRQVRPWYPRNYLCLFDSLALMLFLLRSGIHVQWIFGVREDPFGAHCWIQCGSVVLNEHLDRSRLYTPIMVV